MREDAPTNVREIGSLRPRLRDDLIFVFQEFSGERCCVLEDPVSSRYHRIGLAEHAIMRRLDGKTPFAEACARAALESGSAALGERSALAVLSWLVENRLADLGGNVPIDVLDESRSRKLSASLGGFFNLLSIRIPLGSPDAVLQKLRPLGTVICSSVFFVFWLVIALGGLSQVLLHRDEWNAGASGILAPRNWLWLLLVWTILKVWHELWHGLVCAHHGGHVREAGMVLIVMMPMGYVDASSSLAFPSRWKRMQVAAAGMYGELFLAGVAAWAWTVVPDPLVRHLAVNTVFMAGAATLLFNLNPLMRFDGYYLLSDAMGVPNLATRSSAWVRFLAEKLLLGQKGGQAPETGGKPPALYVSYGVLALVWRVLVMATLLVGAALLFRGGGLIIAVLSVLVMLQKMASRSLRALRSGQASDFPWATALGRCGLLVALLALILFVPFRGKVSSPAVAQYRGEEIHRVDLPGFVEEIYVKEGESVVPGQVMLRLSNLEAQNRWKALHLEVTLQGIRHRKKLLYGHPAEAEAEAATLTGLREQEIELEKRVQSLEIRALSAGRVMAPALERLQGVYLSNGQEILRVARPSDIEWVVPVSASAVEDFRKQVGGKVEILPEGRFRSVPGVFARMGARAVTLPEHAALTALGGGDLAVRAAANPTRDQPYELTQPVFWGVVELEGDSPISIRAGERARVRFRSEHALSLWSRSIRAYERFLNVVFARARSSASR